MNVSAPRRQRWLRPAELTVPLQVEPVGPAVVDDSTVNLVLDLALRIGELELSSGAGAADVTATILAVTNAYGLPQCEVDVIFTSITISCNRGVVAAPVTTARVVRFRSLDYTKLDKLSELVHRICTGSVPAEQARAELSDLVTAKHAYPRWVSTAGWAGMAGSIAALLGGDLRLAAIAAVVTALIDRLGRILNRRALPFFFQQVIGAAVVTFVAVGVTASGLLPDDVSPGFVVAAGLTVLLAGLSVVGTVSDAITGFYVTAAGRAFEVALMTAGLVMGVVLALQVGDRVGVDLAPPSFPTPELDQLGSRTPAAALSAAFFALACYAPWRGIIAAALAGATSWTVFALGQAIELSPTVASGAAAVAVGLLGRVIAKRFRLPPLIMGVAGITPLLPGFTTYHGLFQLSVSDNLDGISELLGAGSTGLALAAGVVFGEFIGRPVRTGLGRMERRLSGARLVGPLRTHREH